MLNGPYQQSIMFFQLPEIQRVASRIRDLQGDQQSLNTFLTRAYSEGNRVRGSVAETIRDIIEKAKKDLVVCTNIEDEAENGYLIPEDFSIEELVYDAAQLPEWFQFVFKKEYSKQKKNFDITAKKMYKLHGLRDKKNELACEIKSFQNLFARYEALEENQKSCLNIMGEAETLKNRSLNVTERYSNYLHLVASKITAFLDENISKALNYTSHITQYAQKSHEPLNIVNSGQKKEYTMNSEPTYTAPSFKVENRSPISHYHPPSVCYEHSHHHRPLRSVGFNESRFNYRDHMPRWMNKTLSFYYF